MLARRFSNRPATPPNAVVEVVSLFERARQSLEDLVLVFRFGLLYLGNFLDVVFEVPAHVLPCLQPLLKEARGARRISSAHACVVVRAIATTSVGRGCGVGSGRYIGGSHVARVRRRLVGACRSTCVSGWNPVGPAQRRMQRVRME